MEDVCLRRNPVRDRLHVNRHRYALLHVNGSTVAHAVLAFDNQCKLPAPNVERIARNVRDWGNLAVNSKGARRSVIALRSESPHMRRFRPQFASVASETRPMTVAMLATPVRGRTMTTVTTAPLTVLALTAPLFRASADCQESAAIVPAAKSRKSVRA
jgi:hypothetical protein